LNIARALADAGIEPREARLLLAAACGFSEASVIAQGERELPVEIEARFTQLAARRRAGEPVAYIVGTREFYSLPLSVGPPVLIPRPETELLVELALARVPLDAEMRIADLGTGSGAIALAIARERPLARVLATDASLGALAVARENATRLAVRNIEFAASDWCDALADARFDLIISNPPYIASGDAHLDSGDLRREPLLALVSGVDGLDAIRRIIRQAPAHLCAGGWLLLEHGWDQAARVRQLLDTGAFTAIATECDPAGHERVTTARACA